MVVVGGGVVGGGCSKIFFYYESKLKIKIHLKCFFVGREGGGG